MSTDYLMQISKMHLVVFHKISNNSFQFHKLLINYMKFTQGKLQKSFQNELPKKLFLTTLND